jgi:stress-induced-phosphoprotein 1
MDKREQAELAKEKGNQAVKSKQYDEAISHYTEAIKLDPTNHVYYSNRSSVYAAKKDFVNALKDGEKAVEINSTWSKGYLRKGIAQFYLGKYEAAINTFNKGLELGPDNAQLKKYLTDAKKGLEMQNYRKKQEEQAKKTAQEIENIFSGDVVELCKQYPETRELAEDPEFLALLKKLKANPSLIRQNMGNPKLLQFIQVAVQYQAIERMTPAEREEMMKKERELREREARREAAELDARLKAKREAKKREEERKKAEAEARLTQTQKDAIKIKDTANALYSQKKFEEAIKEYDRAIEVDPTNIVFYNNKGACYFEMGDYDKCIEVCKEAIQIGRENRADFKLVGRAFARIGNANIRKGEYIEAIKNLKDALREDRSANTLKLLSIAEKKQKEKEQQEYYDPELSIKAKEEGNEFYKKNRFPDAVEKYTEAIKRDPSNHALYSNRAAAYTKLLALPQALQDCDKCIELKPEFIKAYIRKGKIHFLRKEFQKCLRVYEKGLEYDPDNKELAQAITKTLIAIENTPLDEETVQRNIQNDPELQTILADPVVQQVLKELSTDPQAAQRYLREPAIAEKISKLQAAGIIGRRRV